MIYDCFSFFNELDVLEIRLNTLNEVVDKFVLVEAPWTHTGKPKPLYFEENKTRFAPFLDKIIHIVAGDPPVSPDKTERESAWIRENWQRNEIKRGLCDAKPEDVLIIGDLDEIPDPDRVASLSKNPISGVLNLNLRSYAFYLNYRNVAAPHWTGGPQMLTYSTFADVKTYEKNSFSEYCPECANPLPSPTLIRFLPRKRNIRDAGWHFSSMGGIKAVQKKLASFAHTEFGNLINDGEKLKEMINSGKGIFGYGDRYMAEPLGNGLPEYLAKNDTRYKDLILLAELQIWRAKTLSRIWIRFCRIGHDAIIGMLIRLVPDALHPMMHRLRSLLQP